MAKPVGAQNAGSRTPIDGPFDQGQAFVRPGHAEQHNDTVKPVDEH